ncbi:putative methyltransferase YcgJ [Clostridium puniceum]|uniref:Putative methyltransferase YcgJ n=1 Tax=Clostridium puniceum TaxID=29367 RepID=A0A1S8TAW2_9CLOT|nr:class I SAM-dependent methyltransferase [Clostridium puniceum]OOM74759.1 putative methyltransferase YcgJ [Clostridium puniceum]
MTELLDKVENYWDKRSEGYCQVNLEELNSFKKAEWIDMINEYAPKITGRKMKVLDIGTGPGFLAIIMASCGYDVTAVDYTEAMLQKAKNNAKSLNLGIQFQRMDAHKLNFADDTFDLIITRNLTWNLEKPQEAYKDWYRVLTSGGILLNFDANWYHHLFYPEKRKGYEQDRANAKAKKIKDHYITTNTVAMEEIARSLPLSKIYRPKWDIGVLSEIGFKRIFTQNDIGSRVWNEEEKVNYGSTPMFMIGAEK